MIEFIKNPGGCVVSRNILDGKGELQWCVREKSCNAVDNGWRFFSSVDDEEYLSHAENMTICNFNTVAEIEPAVLAIYNMPVGTDIVLIRENGIHFYDEKTGEEVDIRK